MGDWTAGYTADVAYTHGYYGELNPLRTRLAFAYAGLAAPEFRHACELGFGQGVSIAMHAAASTTRWWGTDFNPAQASYARQLTLDCGIPVQLSDCAFEEFLSRDDLPEFDYIGLHGIWSWISAENRDVLVRFMRQRLKVGGVVYMSYNAMPGWAAFAPMRHLMSQYAATMAAQGVGSTSRVEQALDFAQKLIDTDPAYAKANALVAPRLEKLKEQNRQYLAHEYFNRDWRPMYFAEVAELLHAAKLQFACSAHLLDHLSVLNLTPMQQAFLAEFKDRGLQESVRDYMLNQQFRRDLWVKGVRYLTPLDRYEALRTCRVVLVTRRRDIAANVTGAAGSADLPVAIYGPLLDILEDHQPRSLGELMDKLQLRGVMPPIVAEAVMLLSAMGAVAPVNENEVAQELRSRTDALNLELCRRSRSSGDVAVLASPLTGGGYAVPRFHQIFLLAIRSGQRAVADVARYTWDILNAQGQRVTVEGRTLETADENVAELARRAASFFENELPLLKSMLIA